jgi:hypothetical protein
MAIAGVNNRGISISILDKNEQVWYNGVIISFGREMKHIKV